MRAATSVAVLLTFSEGPARARNFLDEDHHPIHEVVDVLNFEGIDVCSLDTIAYATLGMVTTMKDCVKKAIRWRNESSPASRCRAACWSRHQPRTTLADSAQSQKCMCLGEMIWMPLPDPSVDSARIVWPCEDDSDCSYNGRCDDKGGRCHCRPAWKGAACEELNLLPVDRSRLGYRSRNRTNNNSNISTWGAPILWDETSQKWHGWASEMALNCGINAWQTNSRLVHIVGETPSGPFRRKDVTRPVFAHEASVVRGPMGEWVLLYSSYEFNSTELEKLTCQTCEDGNTPSVSEACPFQRGYPKELAHNFKQMLSLSQSPYGPWSEPVEIPQLSKPWDWNTALTINADGSAVALLRAGFVWYAQNYSNSDSWRAVGANTGEPQGPPWKEVSVEDPFIWQRDGVYHALAHAFSPFYGVHAYAKPREDFDWDSGDPLEWTVSGVAYSNVVEFTDGQNYTFSRRERPHLVWAAGTEEGVRPVALVNGVQPNGRPNAPGQDGTFTLSQPISSNSGSNEGPTDRDSSIGNKIAIDITG